MRGGMSRSGTRSGSPAWPTSRRCRTCWARCWPAASTTSSAAASTAGTWNGARISRAFAASWRSAPTPSLPSPALGVPATLPEFGGRREDRPHRLPRLPPGQGDHVETLRGLRHGFYDREQQVYRVNPGGRRRIDCRRPRQGRRQSRTDPRHGPSRVFGFRLGRSISIKTGG